jgi:ABC-2 type transport system permease protein
MRAALLLLKHTLKRVRILVAVMGLLLCGFQIVLILVASSVHKSNTFDQLTATLPAFFREMLGPALASFMSFSGLVCLGYFHLAVMGALTTMSIVLSTSPTAEIESGFIDLILSRPVARRWVLTRSIAVVILCAAFLLGMMLLGTFGGLNGLAPRDVTWPAPGLIRTLAINMGLLMLCWSGIAMALAARARRRSVAGALAGVLALVMFLLDYVGRLWKPAESIAWLSPFRYYNPFDLVMGQPLPAKHVFVLLGVAIAGYAVAFVLYSRRDISH